METTMRLLDRIDRNLLQGLQNAFAASIWTAVALADPGGNPITAPCMHGPSCGLDLAGKSAVADACPGISPATVMIFSADTCLGQWVIGGTAPRSAPPAVHALIFMPMETAGEGFGAFGLEPETIRDWPPDALTQLGNLARMMAERLAENATREKPGFSPCFKPGFGGPGPRQRIAM